MTCSRHKSRSPRLFLAAAISLVSSAPTSRRTTSATQFADRFIFEDPAGVLRASDKRTLREFFAQLAFSGFELRFEEKQVIVIGGSCLVAAVSHIEVRDYDRALLELFIVFRLNEAGLIEEFRTYFDQRCIRDELG